MCIGCVDLCLQTKLPLRDNKDYPILHFQKSPSFPRKICPKKKGCLDSVEGVSLVSWKLPFLTFFLAGLLTDARAMKRLTCWAFSCRTMWFLRTHTHTHIEDIPVSLSSVESRFATDYKTQGSDGVTVFESPIGSFSDQQQQHEKWRMWLSVLKNACLIRPLLDRWKCSFQLLFLFFVLVYNRLF